VEAIPPFPNSVNAHDYVVLDKVRDIRSMKYQTVTGKDDVQAVNQYEQFYYEYRNGQVMVTILKIKSQLKYTVDIRA
jgi:ribosomal protein S12|tara:strand:+ start:29 stop:259 length:231 start_codon:yes stop_codon:yes gene_type:complete